MIDKEERHWFVAKTYRKEKKIKLRLDEMGIENFIPFHKVVREKDGKKKTSIEPVISNLIFIHYDTKGSISLVNEYGFEMRYMRNLEDRTLLRVPDKQMSDFIYLIENYENQVEFVSPDLRKGDKVRVIKGDFAGIEGELIRIKGHKRVVVRLENFFALATVYIPGSFLERIPNE